jgi:hypothetical protein
VITFFVFDGYTFTMAVDSLAMRSTFSQFQRGGMPGSQERFR